MKQDKMHLINKIFYEETIRTIWDEEQEKYFISVVDIVSVITDSKDGRKYWNKLKQRLNKEGNETVTNCHQLKLKAQDGKYRETDVTDIEGMFRIIESIPSKNAEPIKQWLARLGKERIDETFDPSIALQRAIDLYRTKGYDEDWIAKRIKSLQERKKLTDLSEEATKRIAAKQKPNGLNENIKVARMGGHAAKVAIDDIERNFGESVVTKENKLNYKYIEEKEIKKKLKDK